MYKYETIILKDKFFLQIGKYLIYLNVNLYV